MPDNFFNLPKGIQHLILSGAESKLNIPAIILEKDIWICWFLKELFVLPTNMAFKGGTSLSKAYNLINRFSEDVDITIDYRFFLPNLDLNQSISRSALKKLDIQLKIQLKQYVNEVILPHLQQRLKANFSSETFKTILNENGEQLTIYYPTLFKEIPGSYLQSSVLLEFGGRNSIEPSQDCKISALLAQAVTELELPNAQVRVLSPLRTFWEKATLIHVECHRNRLSNSPERLSRHWYDLALLARNSIGQQALTNRILLEDVVRHKKAFFNAAYTHYDKCLTNQFQLIPRDDELEKLNDDYTNMVSAGMFSGEAPNFSEIINTLKKLEQVINNA